MRIREADMSYKKHKELTAEQIDIGRRRSKKASAREREAALAMNNAMNASVPHKANFSRILITSQPPR